MIQWLKQKFCNHEYELISQITYIAHELIYDLDREDIAEYSFTERIEKCTKCGHEKVTDTRMK